MESRALETVPDEPFSEFEKRDLGSTAIYVDVLIVNNGKGHVDIALYPRTRWVDTAAQKHETISLLSNECRTVSFEELVDTSENAHVFGMRLVDGSVAYTHQLRSLDYFSSNKKMHFIGSVESSWPRLLEILKKHQRADCSVFRLDCLEYCKNVAAGILNSTHSPSPQKAKLTRDRLAELYISQINDMEADLGRSCSADSEIIIRQAATISVAANVGLAFLLLGLWLCRVRYAS